MKKPRKFIVVIMILIVVVGFIGLAAKKRSAQAQSPTLVQVEQPQRGELIEFISAPGEIEPETNIEISAKVSARIISLPFDEGDLVTKGNPNADPPVPASVLVRLDSRDLESRLRSAQAGRKAQAAQIQVETERVKSQQESLAGLAAQLQQAERDLQRQQELLKSSDISQSAFDQAKLTFDELKAQVQSQRHQLRAAQLNLEVLRHRLAAADEEIEQALEALNHTVITSPIDGVITRLNAEVGEMVMTGTMNNPGTVILEVADLDRMLVVAQVGEADVGKLALSQKAEVTVQAFPDDTFLGRVDAIALKHRLSNTGTKYYRTEILLDNDPNVAKLYTGLTAHVEIETVKHENVLTLPSQAVLGRPVDDLPLEIREQSAEVQKEKTITLVVYRYVDGKAVVTPVTLGSGNLTHRIITSGLSEKDKIIVGPYRVLDGLKHDQAVKDEQEASADNATDTEDEPNDPNEP